MEKLRECPFCGGEAEICKEVPPRPNSYDYEGAYTLFFVGCTKCRASGGLWIGENKIPEAIKAWNTRYEPPSPHGIIVPAGNKRLKGNKGGNIMTYPVIRDLDGCFFRIQRGDQWLSLCWTDLTKAERVEVLKDKDKYWLRRMLEYITEEYRKTGDQLDIYGGEPDENL